MSTASTGTPQVLMISIAAAGSPRTSLLRPVPKIASTTASAPVAAVAQARQRGVLCHLEEQRRADACRRAGCAARRRRHRPRGRAAPPRRARRASCSRRAMTNPSPPLLPLPATISTRRPRRRRRGTHCEQHLASPPARPAPSARGPACRPRSSADRGSASPRRLRGAWASAARRARRWLGSAASTRGAGRAGARIQRRHAPHSARRHATIAAFISRTAASRPMKRARATRLWPMLSSCMPAMRGDRADVVDA